MLAPKLLKTITPICLISIFLVCGCNGNKSDLHNRNTELGEPSVACDSETIIKSFKRDFNAYKQNLESSDLLTKQLVKAQNSIDSFEIEKRKLQDPNLYHVIFGSAESRAVQVNEIGSKIISLKDECEKNEFKRREINMHISSFEQKMKE